MTSLLLHSNLSGPPQMNRHSFNQIEWSMTSTLNEWPTSLICDELELDFATRPSKGGGDVRQRVESIFIGKFFRARIPVDWDWLAERAINVRYRTRDAAPQLVLSLSLRSQFLATASTLYLSLMGKLNIQPIKDGHVYLLQGRLATDWLNSIKTKKNLLWW